MSSSRCPSSSHAVVSHGCHVCVRWVPAAMRRWGYTSVCHNNHDFSIGQAHTLTSLQPPSNVRISPRPFAALSSRDALCCLKQFILSTGRRGARKLVLFAYLDLVLSTQLRTPSPRLLTVPDCRFSGVSPVFSHTVPADRGQPSLSDEIAVDNYRQLSAFFPYNSKMRNARNHRRRSRSKDKDYHRRSVTALADARKTISVFAFAVGALLVVFLWAWLQAHGVRGPWARAVGSQGSGQEERWAPTGCERIFCCEHMNVFSAP